MKKIIGILLVAILFTSCKKEDKKQENSTPKKQTKELPFSLKKANNFIGFTAYKTTGKVPVSGRFTKVKVTKNGEGNSIKEALNGAEFEIPVTSIRTEDSSRDFKIQKFFFAVMENTMSLKGKITLVDDKSGVVLFTMNGVSDKLPFEYEILDGTFTMKSTMNIDKWNAQKAIKSLNDICKDLHSGKDGVSKTWSEVSIVVKSKF